MALIESERLYVRYLTMDDYESYFILNNDEEVVRYIRAPKNREEAYVFLQEVIARYKSKKTDWRLALLEKGSDLFVGSFAIIPIGTTDEMQLGYSLLKEHWGKGYATEIVQAGLTYAFTVLNMTEIAGVTEVENTASQKVLIKNGFVFEKTYEEAGRQLNLYRKLRAAGFGL
jgi:ribosomal-protein-alanine N-acetyltransferase